MKKILLTIYFIIPCMIALSCLGAPALKFKVTGIDGKLLKTITTKLQSKVKSIKISDKEAIENFYNEAPKNITKTLKFHGYFKASVSSRVSIYKRKRWLIFNVKPGAPLKITKIELKTLGEGAKDKNIIHNLHNFPLKEGEILKTDKYNTAKQFLFDLADEYGYIAASFQTKEIQIDLDNNTAKIILHFNIGPKYYFGKTSFYAPKFSPAFLRRFLTYKPDEYYSSKKIHSLQESLSNSNFFQKITIKPQTEKSESNKVPIDITLTPKKPRRYSLGAGFGTDTGVRGSLETELRHLTRTGQSFNGLIQASQAENNLELHYLIPGKNPSTDLYNISLAGETIDLDKGKSFNAQFGIGYTTIIKNWQQTLKLNLQHERYKLIDQPYRNSTSFIPSVNLLYTKKDHLTKPTKGYRVNINLQGTVKYVLSSSNFLQLQVETKYLHTFATKTQVVLHAILGYTMIDNINNLPLSLQFYTGGTQSIRGFGYNTIGPGNNIAVGSIELRQKIFGDFYLAAFFDAGNVSDDLFKKPNQGAGVGIVWRTSIGALELTFAKAISKPGTPGLIQFTMGPEL